MELHLDRLTLRVSGITVADGHRLVERVGAGLAAATPPPSGGGGQAISLALAARPGEPIEALAGRIVAELVRSLARSVS